MLKKIKWYKVYIAFYMVFIFAGTIVLRIKENEAVIPFLLSQIAIILLLIFGRLTNPEIELEIDIEKLNQK